MQGADLRQRRGWVPSADDIGEDTYGLFPNLAHKHYVGQTSVTEMEILHALVDPLHNGILHNTKDDSRSGEATEHAFFYLREPKYLEYIPHQDLRAIYTNAAERDPATADRELTRWREQVVPQTGRPVHAYASGWQSEESTPEISLPLCVPTTAPKESDAWRNAYAEWEKRWAVAGVGVDESGEITGAELDKAHIYNTALTKGRLGDFQVGSRSLADVVIEQLKAAIAARYPAHMAIDDQTPLQKEIDQQAQFLRLASEGFIERTGDFEALREYLQGNESRPFAVTAYAGMGKTSLLAHFIDTYQLQGNESLHYRFIGGSDDSVNAERLVRSLLSELEEAGKLRSDIPVDSAEMMSKLPELLAEAGAKSKVILVIDALNQLESGMGDLHWIPAVLPENVKLIVSFKRGEDSAEKYYRQQEESSTMLLHSIRPFESLNDRKALVAAYLEQYFKELDEPRIQALIESDGAENPLFLKVALSELRVFGVHNDLSEVIRSRFGNTPVKAFHAILERIEKDPAYTKLAPAVALPHVLGWMAHSRYGMSAEELAELLVLEGLADDKTAAFDCVYLILRQLRPFLAKRDGRVDFFYESFKLAAVERYTEEHAYARPAQAWHRSLSGYFETVPFENRHRLMEQAWQYARAGCAEELAEWLLDVGFLGNRMALFGIRALAADFVLAEETNGYGSLLPSVKNAVKAVQQCLTLSATRVLDKNPDQWPQQLFARMGGRGNPRIQKLFSDILAAKRGFWARPYFPYLQPPGGSLVKTLTARSQRIYSAFDWDEHEGVVLTPGGKNDELDVWSVSDERVLRTFTVGFSILAAKLNPAVPEILLTSLDRDFVAAVSCMDGRTRGVIDGVSIEGDIAFTKDGARFFFGGKNREVYECDTATLQVRSRHVVLVYPDAFASVAVSGNLLAFGQRRKYVRVVGERGMYGDEDSRNYTSIGMYDLKKKKMVAEVALDHEDDMVNCLAFSEEGDKLLVGTWKGRIVQITLTAGMFKQKAEKRTLAELGYSVTSVAFLGNGDSFISASYDRVLRVWDGETCVRTLHGHDRPIRNMRLSQDGRRACTSDEYSDIKVWDISGEPEEEEQARSARANSIEALALMEGRGLVVSTPQKRAIPSGRRLLTPRESSRSGIFQLWSAETGALLSERREPSLLQGDFSTGFSKDGGRFFASYAYEDEYEDVRGFKTWALEYGVGEDGQPSILKTEKLTERVLDTCKAYFYSSAHPFGVSESGLVLVGMTEDEELPRLLLHDMENDVEVWQSDDRDFVLDFRSPKDYDLPHGLIRSDSSILKCDFASKAASPVPWIDASMLWEQASARDSAPAEEAAPVGEVCINLLAAAQDTDKVCVLAHAESLEGAERDSLIVFNPNDPRDAKRYACPLRFVDPLILSPDGRIIVAYDGSRRILSFWDAETGETCSYVSESQITSNLVFSADTRRVYFGCESGIVCCLRLEN